MKATIQALIALAAVLLLVSAGHAQVTMTAHKTGEEITGLTKQCFYEWAGNRYTRTIKAYQLCALSIQVRL